jgi:hypothetical protein
LQHKLELRVDSSFLYDFVELFDRADPYLIQREYDIVRLEVKHGCKRIRENLLHGYFRFVYEENLDIGQAEALVYVLSDELELNQRPMLFAYLFFH